MHYFRKYKTSLLDYLKLVRKSEDLAVKRSVLYVKSVKMTVILPA